MARQNIRTNPSLKLFEAYMDFSGGRNSETSNERLRDNEFPVLDNVDLSSRGSVKRRHGRRLLTSHVGLGQGLFFFYRSGQPEPDVVLAIGGALYVRENSATVDRPITILDGTTPFTFQATKPIEAVQYGVSMFIATGTKLCELAYDNSPPWATNTAYTVGQTVKAGGRVYVVKTAGTSGATPPTHTVGDATDNTVIWTYQFEEWNAKVVVPYTPTVMEAIYIGTNGLAPNPDAYVQSGVSTSLEVAGIKPPNRTGVVNQVATLVAYINKPETITAVDYKWEYKKSSEPTTWKVGRDWTADTAGSKTWDWRPDTPTKWDIRVTVRKTGTTTPAPEYVLSTYEVKEVEDKSNTSRPVTGIQRCRRIVLHWDRLVMTGDDANPFQIYISDLNAPRYFPTTNTISYDTGKQEPITAMVRYRDMLVVFTKTSVQTLVGRSPDDYQRGLIHDGIGCISERGAAVAGNNVVFLSAEGIHILKPNALVLDVMSVQRIDYPIKSEVEQDGNACTMVYDSQFWMCLPSSSEIFRLYYDNKMWVRDTSSKLNLAYMTHYGSDVYELSMDGKVYQQDKGLWTDDSEVYETVVESKFLDLEASFNFKKLKRLYILGRHYDMNVAMRVRVQADAAFVLDPEAGEAVIQPDGSTVWTTTSTPNLNFYAGTILGSWILGTGSLGTVPTSVQKAQIRGKCRRVRVRFTHSQDTPCEIFGFGLEFKEKKP